MSLGCMVKWVEINGKMVYQSNFDAIRIENSMCDICTNKKCDNAKVLAKMQDNGLRFIITRCKVFHGKG